MEWLTDFWASLTLQRVLVGAALFVGSVILSALLVGIVVVKVPANYFSPNYQRDFLPNSPWFTRWGAVVAKNIAGVILVLAGVVMLIGPGQGVLTILIGLILIDIPGKRPFEAKIIERPAVRNAIDKLRAKYGKPPLVLD